MQLQQKYCSKSITESKYWYKHVQRAQCVWLHGFYFRTGINIGMSVMYGMSWYTVVWWAWCMVIIGDTFISRLTYRLISTDRAFDQNCYCWSLTEISNLKFFTRSKYENQLLSPWKENYLLVSYQVTCLTGYQVDCWFSYQYFSNTGSSAHVWLGVISQDFLINWTVDLSYQVIYTWLPVNPHSSR